MIDEKKVHLSVGSLLPWRAFLVHLSIYSFIYLHICVYLDSYFIQWVLVCYYHEVFWGTLFFCYFFFPLTKLGALEYQRMMVILPCRSSLWQSLAQGKGCWWTYISSTRTADKFPKRRRELRVLFLFICSTDELDGWFFWGSSQLQNKRMCELGARSVLLLISGLWVRVRVHVCVWCV